jgi:hypothetical protein
MYGGLHVQTWSATSHTWCAPHVASDVHFAPKVSAAGAAAPSAASVAVLTASAVLPSASLFDASFEPQLATSSAAAGAITAATDANANRRTLERFMMRAYAAGDERQSIRASPRTAGDGVFTRRRAGGT